MDRDRVISAVEVEGLIADGHIIVIYEDLVLKLDSWLERHPGGSLAIQHMVGRDSTDEIKAYVLSPPPPKKKKTGLSYPPNKRDLVFSWTVHYLPAPAAPEYGGS